MSATWTTIAALALATAAIKASGPLVLGGRDLPRWALRLISLTAPALLAALVAVETFGGHKSLVLDPRAAGAAAAGATLAAGRGVVAAGILAAVVAALVRAIS